MMVYDIVCRNSQSGNGQEPYTFDQVSHEVKKNGKVLNYSEILLSLNDKFESSMRPSSIFDEEAVFFITSSTTLLLNFWREEKEMKSSREMLISSKVYKLRQKISRDSISTLNSALECIYTKT